METALLNICVNILQNMENNTFTAMVVPDFSAAFDTVNHKTLLDVPNKYFGIQGMAIKRIKSYLTNSFVYKLMINSDFSVPQGSILGPVLFTYYASTLQELFTDHSSLSGYADDHSFIKAFKPIDYKILTELELDIKHIRD